MAVLSTDEQRRERARKHARYTYGPVPIAARHAKATEASRAISDGTNDKHNL
jgi:hypothetical protein